MNAEKQKHWNDVYAGVGAVKVSWFQRRADISMRLIQNSGANSTSAIIDVGGGSSVLVDQLLDAGFGDVTVLDISERALDGSRERLGARANAVHWIVADVLEWIPARAYDVWHDRAVFHFLTDEKDRAIYRAALKKGVRAKGMFILGTFAEDGPERCSGLPVARWSVDRLKTEFADGFRLVESLGHAHHTPKGVVQPFTWARFERE
jgi:SAM-dependent methyltransferase